MLERVENCSAIARSLSHIAEVILLTVISSEQNTFSFFMHHRHFSSDFIITNSSPSRFFCIFPCPFSGEFLRHFLYYTYRIFDLLSQNVKKFFCRNFQDKNGNSMEIIDSINRCFEAILQHFIHGETVFLHIISFYKLWRIFENVSKMLR